MSSNDVSTAIIEALPASAQDSPGGTTPPPPEDTREVDYFTACLTMVDFIDHEMPKLGSIAELRAALLIWRKTHGWGQLSDQIGVRQLAKAAGTDQKSIARALSGKRPGDKGGAKLAEKIGILSEQGRDAAGDLARTRYTWPINERVQAKLVKAAAKKAARVNGGGGVQFTPTPGVQSAPTGGVQFTPTQSSTDQSSTGQSAVTDYQRTNRKSGDSHAGLSAAGATDSQQLQKPTPKPPCREERQYTQDERDWMRDLLGSYGRRRTMREYMREEVPALIVQRCLDAADGEPLNDIREILRYKCVKRGLDPGISQGPQGWGWFPKVITNEVLARREQDEAMRNPARKKHWSEYESVHDPIMDRAISSFSSLDDAMEATA